MLFVEVEGYFFKLFLTPEQARQYGLKDAPRLINLSKLRKERDLEIQSFAREWR